MNRQSGSRLLGLPLLGLLFSLVLAPAASAQEDAPTHQPRIVTHMVPWSKGMRLNCFEHGVKTAEDVVTKGTAPPAGADPQIYLIYVLVTGFKVEDGLGGIQFGIAYDPKQRSGIDITGWQDCGSMEFHEDDWPMAGTGNLITWETKNMCVNQEPAVVGFLAAEVYSDDTFKIIPRPVDTRAAISNCQAKEFQIPRTRLGTLDFGKGSGYNPWNQEQLDARESEESRKAK